MQNSWIVQCTHELTKKLILKWAEQRFHQILLVWLFSFDFITEWKKGDQDELEQAWHWWQALNIYKQ